MKLHHVMLFTLAPLLVSLPGTSADAPGRHAVHRSLRWIAPDAGTSLSGLYLIDVAPAGMVSRVLAEAPGGRFTMITSTLDAGRGLSRTELSSADGGWTALLVIDSGVRRPTLDGYFAATERELSTGAPVTMRLVLPDDFSFEAEVGVDYPAVMHAELLKVLSSEGLLEQVVAAIPEDIKPALLFLDRSLSPSPFPTGTDEESIAHSLRGPIEILAGALRRVEPYRRESDDEWRMQVGPARRGLKIEDPELVEIVEHFPTLTTTDPLADRRAASTAEAEK